MRGIRFGLAVATATLGLTALAGPAQAAVTIGQTVTPTACGNTQLLIAQTTVQPQYQRYEAPSAGVLTSFSVQGGSDSGSGDDTMQLTVLRGVGGADYKVIAESDPVVVRAGTLETFPVRISVLAGDIIAYQAISTTGAGFSCAAMAASGNASQYCGGCNPATGDTATLGSTQGGILTDISAKLEADADGDGYGDETQDKCPTNAARFDQECDTNLVVTNSASPSSVAPGDNVVITATATNSGASPARSVVMVVTIPDQLAILFAAANRGADCQVTGRTITCNIGDVPGNAVAKVQVATRAASVGSGTSVAVATTSSTDVDNSNNSASAGVTVASPAPQLKPGACANSAVGTSAKDVLTGTTAGDNVFGLQGNDVLSGLVGDDCLSGGPGNDNIDGGAGNDTIYGEDGNDKLSGGTGNDTIDGGPGNDTISGGQGTNKVKGGAGKDTINVADGKKETVDCGPGRDTARVDKRDKVKGCEKVIRAKK